MCRRFLRALLFFFFQQKPAFELRICDWSSDVCSSDLAFAIAAALYGRERSGHGTAIDVSMTDGLVSWMAPYLVPHMSGDKAFEVFDEPAYGIFTCSDGKQLTLSIAHEDHFWATLCHALELPQHAGLKAAERRRRRTELHGEISALLAQQPRAHWAAAFDTAGNIAWSPLHDFTGVLQDPHFRARGLFRPLPRGGEQIGRAHV